MGDQNGPMQVVKWTIKSQDTNQIAFLFFLHSPWALYILSVNTRPFYLKP